MLPTFRVVDVTYPESGKPTFRVIIIDDEKYLGYVFTYQDIDLIPDENGIGIEYDLIINLRDDLLPTTISEEETQKLKAVGHSIIEKIMTDMVNSINLDIA